VKVKICGLTRTEDAALAVELGADLLGINFWPGSPRGVAIEQGATVAAAARAVAAAAGRPAPLVAGVFVDQDPVLVGRAAEAAALDLVQLHGDETPAQASALRMPPGRVLKAFRVGGGLDAAAAADEWPQAWGLLFDAARAGLYGGTGTSFAWWRVAGVAAGRRVLVAGGIAPGRLGELLGAVKGWRPWGIDVCSGVERAPGIKDPEKLRALFEEVRDGEVTTVA
jgi:phosphoribosylanthranilate isomerase